MEILDKGLQRMKAYENFETISTKWLKFSQRLYTIIISSIVEYYKDSGLPNYFGIYSIL